MVDESRAVGAARKKQNAGTGRRERLAVGAAHAELGPFRESAAALHVVEALRHGDLEAPGQAALPMLLGEIIGGGGEHVRHIAPEVGFAVAGKIDGVIDDVGRHELGLAHGAGPGAHHLVAAEMAVLHDAHGDDQLVAEIRMAVVHVTERRQRAEYVPVVFLRAVVGLDAPERDQHPALDAEFLFHRVEGLGPLGGFLLAARMRPARDRVVDVGADRLAVFRLPLGGGDHAGSGVTPFSARSKVARVMPLACASGHSSASKAAKDWSLDVFLRARRRGQEDDGKSEYGETGEHSCGSLNGGRYRIL